MTAEALPGCGEEVFAPRDGRRVMVSGEREYGAIIWPVPGCKDIGGCRNQQKSDDCSDASGDFEGSSHGDLFHGCAKNGFVPLNMGGQWR